MAAHNLPIFVTPFIGRDDEINQLSQLLGDPTCRLLTLVGPGGIGKTRLAVEVARCKLDTFPDGVYFVPLQPIQTTDQVLSTIIDALPFQVSDDPQQGLLDYLREKRLLLILDNFEHVLNRAALVSDMLAAAPQIKLVITSREILNLQGEWVRQVNGLTYPDDSKTKDTDDYSAIELFVESARRLRNDFSLEREYEHVVRICQLVEGMPLGIELAAGWLKTLPSTQVAQRTQQSLDFLAATLRDVPERHRSLRAVFDQSWQMLTIGEQAMFRKLSVFQGGFELDAAEQVAAATLGMLANLVDKSLVKTDTNGRYSLHEVLREYAEERLGAAGEGESTRQAHSEYYVRFVQQREPDVKGQRQLEAYRELATDFLNIRAAWLWLAGEGDFDVIGCIIECLYRFSINQNRAQEFWKLCQATMEVLPTRPGEEPHPIWGQIAARAVFISNGEILREDVERSVILARRRNDVAEIGHSLWALGALARLKNDVIEALAQFEDCLTYYRRLDDPFYIADALIWVGGCHEDVGHYQAAYDHTLQCLELRRAIGDKVGQAWCLLNLSNKELRKANYAIAQAFADEALTLHRQIGNNTGIITASAQLGLIYLLRGESRLAQSYSLTALQSAIDLCSRNAEENAKPVAGIVASLTGDYDRGLQLLEAAYQEVPDPSTLKYDSFWDFNVWGLAATHCVLGNYGAAKTYLSTLYRYGTAKGRATSLTLTLPIQALILAHDGDKSHAAELLSLACNHPKSATDWIDKWPPMARLRADLEAELGSEAYAAAWEHGMSLDLEQVTEELLCQFAPEAKDRIAWANQLLPDPLSVRELEVLVLIAEGLTNHEIADQLYIGVSTVKKHINHIYSRLDVQHRTQAVIRARTLNILS